MANPWAHPCPWMKSDAFSSFFTGKRTGALGRVDLLFTSGYGYDWNHEPKPYDLLEGRGELPLTPSMTIPTIAHAPNPTSVASIQTSAALKAAGVSKSLPLGASVLQLQRRPTADVCCSIQYSQPVEIGEALRG